MDLPQFLHLDRADVATMLRRELPHLQMSGLSDDQVPVLFVAPDGGLLVWFRVDE
jgi:hypothetical protein